MVLPTCLSPHTVSALVHGSASHPFSFSRSVFASTQGGRGGALLISCVQPASATLAPDCPCVSCRRRRRGHCRAGRCCRCRRPAGGGRDDALRFTTASTPCLRAGGARVGRADGAAGAACSTQDSTATRLAPTRQNNDDDEGGAHGDCPVPSFLLMPRGADR